jgi:hypothetical protein
LTVSLLGTVSCAVQLQVALIGCSFRRKTRTRQTSCIVAVNAFVVLRGALGCVGMASSQRRVPPPVLECSTPRNALSDPRAACLRSSTQVSRRVVLQDPALPAFGCVPQRRQSESLRRLDGGSLGPQARGHHAPRCAAHPAGVPCACACARAVRVRVRVQKWPAAAVRAVLQARVQNWPAAAVRAVLQACVQNWPAAAVG